MLEAGSKNLLKIWPSILKLAMRQESGEITEEHLSSTM